VGRHHLDDLLVLGAPGGLQVGGGGQVAGLALTPGQGLVGDPADQVLQEPVLAALGRTRVGLDGQQLLADQAGEQRLQPLVPVIVGTLGLRWALVVAGGALLAVTFAAVPRLRGLDRRAEATRRELAPRVELLERLGVFDGAPRQQLETMAAALEGRAVPAGAAVVTEGEQADAFYLVRSGGLAVLSAGERGGEPARVNTLGPGDYFGEIGLLERIPRTATVRAETDTLVWRLAGDDFLGIRRCRTGLNRCSSRSRPSPPTWARPWPRSGSWSCCARSPRRPGSCSTPPPARWPCSTRPRKR
jgi:hypothetical protein